MGRSLLKYIEFECKRCGSSVCIIYENGPHLECRCESCNEFIKYIKKKDLHNYKEVDVPEEDVNLQTLNFKLDLILAHLGIEE